MPYHGFFHQVIPDKVALWCDHMPNLELKNHHHLSLSEVKEKYFGYNTLEEELISYQLSSDSLIAVDYTNLEFSASCPIKIGFLPMYFIRSCRNYKKLLTGFAAEFDKKVAFNCPMHNIRYSRIIASCWLFNNAGPEEFFYTQNWQKEQYLSVLDELLQLGGLIDFTRSQNIAVDNLNYYVFGDYIKTASNESNFFELMQPYYSSSMISVVLGCTFWENGSMICEKYLQAIYGATIPIADGYEVYDHLKKIGFDIFDDIIDTSYQYEKNPVLRVWHLFEKNQDLLANALDLIPQKQIQERLQYNLSLAQDIDGLIDRTIKNLNTYEIADLLGFYKKEILSAFNFEKNC